jgi:hypothetical protein
MMPPTLEDDMEIPVLVEPIPTGFRASTGSPLNLTAEGATSDEAVLRLRQQWAIQLLNGVRAVSVILPEPDPLFEHAARLGANPLFDEWERYVKEARREREAAEEAEEAAKEAASQAAADRNGHPTENPTATEPAR